MIGHILALFDFCLAASELRLLCILPSQYVDFLDATGTLFSMANFVNLYVPGKVLMKIIITEHYPPPLFFLSA